MESSLSGYVTPPRARDKQNDSGLRRRSKSIPTFNRSRIITIIHDENSTHIQLDVVAFLLCLKQIEGSTVGHEQPHTKLKLALNAEMLHRQVVLPIIRQRLKERCVLLVRLILRLSHPEGFVLVELLPLLGHLPGTTNPLPC